MLTIGSPAPELDAPASDRPRLTLADFRGRPLVLFFFPKAFTSGCTRETIGFRDEHAELAQSGAAIVGVSTDELPTQCRFAERYEVPFPLIADSDRRICRAYGTLWADWLPFSRRVTYVIDEVGVIEQVFHHELFVGHHLRDVREHLARRRPR